MADGVHFGVHGARTAGPSGRVTIALADLARGVVATSAPEQMELLALVTARWEAGLGPGSRRRGRLGGSVGSGIDPLLTSEIIYPLLTGAFAQILGTAAVAGWRRRWWRHHQPAEVPAVPAVRVTLEAGQLEAVRAACVAHGRPLGLSKARAVLLADAIYGVLCQAMDDSGPSE